MGPAAVLRRRDVKTFAAMLEASVRRVGETITVNAQLISRDKPARRLV